MKDIKDMTTAELVAEYNQLTGKNTKRFSTRKAGEKQVAAARGKGSASTATVKPGKVAKVTRTRKPTGTGDRAASVKESWNVRAVKAARSQRDNVKVDGTDYRSVGAAFKALNLPMGKHIRFRGELKKAGKLAFEHNDHKFNFAVVAKAD